MPQIVGCASSQEVWEALSRKRKRILQLRLQLQNQKKDNLSISKYISFITKRYDALHVTGDKIDEQDLILLTLSGLGREYR